MVWMRTIPLVQDCLYKYKICRNCNRKGHRMSCCKKIKQSRVKINQIDNQNFRKYLYVKIQNKKVKMQLDSGSGISIINTQT